MNSWEDVDYYARFDPYWDETLDYITMLLEVGEKS